MTISYLNSKTFEDTSSFFNYLLMPSDMFDELFNSLSLRLTKKDTNFRKALHPGLKLADDAFALRQYLMKPYSRRGLSEADLIANYRISRARRVMENDFGILANRWQFLLNTSQHGPDVLPKNEGELQNLNELRENLHRANNSCIRWSPEEMLSFPGGFRKLRLCRFHPWPKEELPLARRSRKKFTDEGYKIHNLPFVTNVVKTSFPYISLLSIFIAMSKVYPRVAEYVQEHKLCAHPCLEIYDGKNIHFMAPLAKQDEFYVAEYNQPSPEDDASELEDPSLAESLPDDSISYSEPSFSEISQSLSTDLTVSTEDKEGEVIKMAAVQAGAGEAKNLADSGFSSDAVPSPLSGSLQVEDPADTGSEGSSGSPFEDIKGETEELIKEMNQQVESKE
ncbi:uncharacterized protein LOC124270646 [Haliotis rubra]|uniref:uncharacterized protein LOC124270646 n=1 Tax=Haliotis rubra TaxID=36100 RepID=UPI001EE5248A|nr:uncharacterized protein LOC124270646 [Haliotis rubra]